MAETRNKTIFDNESVEDSIELLQQLTGLSESQIKRMVPLMQNLSAVYGMSLRAATDIMCTAYKKTGG